METDFVRWLRQSLPRNADLKVGVGDDAAVMSFPNSNLVITSDLLCDGVHFDLKTNPPQKVGRKAMAVNLSDMAAMAAQPRAATVSLLIPQGRGADFAKSLIEGMLDAANAFDVSIIGGDTNSWSSGLVMDITMFGTPHPKGSLLRSGAQVGDDILVTGALGGSILGHHLDFIPRIREAQQLQHDYRLSSGMDITDGLLLDLSRICEASNVGAVLDLSSIPVSESAIAVSRLDSIDPLEHALSDGEDFELLLTAPPKESKKILEDQPLDVPLSLIGYVAESTGLWKKNTDDRLEPLQASGYQHEL